MSVSKRNLLHILGFGGLAAATMDGDAVQRLPGDHLDTFRGPSMDKAGVAHLKVNKYNPEKMAQALEGLAQSIRDKRVTIAGLNINHQVCRRRPRVVSPNPDLRP